MKIEIKPQDFRDVVEWLREQLVPAEISLIINNTLEPAYHRAFLKYKDEKLEYEVGETVMYRRSKHSQYWRGVISSIMRRADGKYLYVVEYCIRTEENEDGTEEWETRRTNPLTKKNLKKKA